MILGAHKSIDTGKWKISEEHGDEGNIKTLKIVDYRHNFSNVTKINLW